MPKKYELNIEGTVREWDRETITLAELRTLGGFGPDQEMIEIELKTNQETVLSDAAPIELKSGKGYAKKVEFKRG